MKEIGSLLVLLCLLVSQAPGRPEGSREALLVTIGGAQVSVEYGRPELKGRDMLGMLQNGQVWRFGMNRATVLASDKTLLFGETKVEPGRFSVFARKISDSEWSLIFNSEPDIWGTQRIAENDIAEIPVRLSDLKTAVEKFSIRLIATGNQTGLIVVEWGALSLHAEFTVSE